MDAPAQGALGLVIFFFFFFALGVGFTLCPEIVYIITQYTMIMQRIRIIVGNAGFELTA